MHELIKIIKAHENMKMNPELEEFFVTAEYTNSNIFLTGAAGCGKSWAIDMFVRYSKKRIILLAPTGVAAVNIGGQTIHSFFKLFNGVQDRISIPHASFIDVVRDTDVFIIDEISMVRSDILHAINAKLQQATGKTSLPFGGKQIIVIGDLFQLPPVLLPAEQEHFNSLFESKWFFSIKGIGNFHTINLITIYRQSDESFKDILNRIRIGSHTSSDLSILNKNVLPNANLQDIIIITTTNKIAEDVNTNHLSQLTGKEYQFRASIDDIFPASAYPVPETLTLKVGSQVMIMKNNIDEGIYNGLIGSILSINNNTILVRTSVGDKVIKPTTWEFTEYQRISSEVRKVSIGTFKQVPLKLAWAITIHKSQSQSFDNVLINMGFGAFTPGQTYVALSRARTLDGLFLSKSLRNSDIIVDKEVVEFHQKLDNRVSKI